MTALGRALTENTDTSMSVGAILVDIDHFKEINDSLGHQAGDAALSEFSRSLTAGLRRSDQLGRYGGKEFLIVVTNTKREAVKNRRSGCVRRLPPRLSVLLRSEQSLQVLGLAFSDGVSDTAQDIVGAADRALYAAKTGERNRIVAA